MMAIDVSCEEFVLNTCTCIPVLISDVVIWNVQWLTRKEYTLSFTYSGYEWHYICSYLLLMILNHKVRSCFWTFYHLIICFSTNKGTSTSPISKSRDPIELETLTWIKCDSEHILSIVFNCIISSLDWHCAALYINPI